MEKNEVSRNDIHTAFDQKLESSISRTARLLCTFYPWSVPVDKDSASSAVSGRRCKMRTLPEIIEDLDTVLKACIKEYGVSADTIIVFAALTAELKDYAESHEDDLK